MYRSLLVAAVAAALALPAAAGASTVTGTPDPGNPSWTDATFTGSSGVNDVTLESWPSIAWADLAQPLTAAGLCTAGPPVTCPPGPATVNLGGGADRLTNNGYGWSLTVSGGTGNDRIKANGSSTTVHGNDDQDTIDVRANGTAYGYGDNGADALRGAYPTGPGTALSGGWGTDLLVGAGGFGTDQLQGNQDADQLVSVRGGGTADGGGGNDTLVNLGLYAMGVNLIGGAGADTIAGGDGSDAVNAGTGNDVIDVTDHDADTVACGDGTDVVYAGPEDTVAADCESVRPGPAPALAAVGQALAHVHEVFPDTPTGNS